MISSDVVRSCRVVDVPPAVDEALAQPTRARLFALLSEL